MTRPVPAWRSVPPQAPLVVCPECRCVVVLADKDDHARVHGARALGEMVVMAELERLTDVRERQEGNVR